MRWSVPLGQFYLGQAKLREPVKLSKLCELRLTVQERYTYNCDTGEAELQDKPPEHKEDLCLAKT